MKTVKIIQLVIVLFPAVLISNMRAPYHVSWSGGSMIRTKEPLTVMSESLTFTFEKLYTNKDPVDASKPLYAKVSAVYKIQSQKSIYAVMEFISPSDENVSVRINGNACDI